MLNIGLPLKTTLFLERHTPWRVSDYLNTRNDAALRSKYREWLKQTPPAPVVGDAPSTEVHQLLGHRHIGMGLWSLKSLVKAADAELGVVVHDDGSLTDEDMELLRQHLPGVRIVARPDADERMREALANYPACTSFRFGNVPVTNHRGQSYNMFIMALILFDINLLTECDKIIILDADVLFSADQTSLPIGRWTETIHEASTVSRPTSLNANPTGRYLSAERLRGHSTRGSFV